MKSKKLFLPAIILVVAVLAMAVCSVATTIAKKPTVTEAQFPFSITYEYNGETVTIKDFYKAYYEGIGGYADTKGRNYVGEIGNMGENNTIYYIKQEDGYGSLELHTQFYPDYMMGDPEYDYFDDEAFEPFFLYYDVDGQQADEETLAAQGVKLISWEYPTPIENSFVFSHFSIFSGIVVFPTLLIGLLALLATIIFVKKDSDFVRNVVDVISTVFNFLIGIILLPFVSIAAILMDITDINEHILCQMFYFLPALIVLGITASVAMRRRGYKKTSLAIQFIGPVAFAAILIAFGVLGL